MKDKDPVVVRRPDKIESAGRPGKNNPAAAIVTRLEPGDEYSRLCSDGMSAIHATAEFSGITVTGNGVSWFIPDTVLRKLMHGCSSGTTIVVPQTDSHRLAKR